MYVRAHRIIRPFLVAACAALSLAASGGAGAQQLAGVERLRELAKLDAQGAAATQGLASLAELRSLEELSAFARLENLQMLKSAGSLADMTRLSALASVDASVAGMSELSALGGLTINRHEPVVDIRRGGDEQAADSLYRKAREALTAGEYRRAATLFQQIVQKYPKTRSAGDALYFRAFALYRTGDTGELRTALGDLDQLATKYSGAGVSGDARTLRVRICGELARRGDERCAAEVEALGAGSSAGQGSSGSASASSSSGSGTRATRTQAGQCPSEDDDDDERIAALNALLQMDSERALPILEKVLARRDACSVGLRRKAVFLVSQKGNEKAADMLLNAAKTDPDKEVRGQALFWLGQTRDERAVDMLGDVLKNSDDRELQDKAIFGLSQHRSDRAQQLLRDVALNESMATETREQAIFWLGQRSGGNNAAFLRELYDRLKSNKLKEKILFSASQQRSTETATWLLGVAQNEREDVELRKNALFWAGQNKMISLNDLGAMYAKLSDREMKEQVIFVLSQRRDSVAVDKLLDIAKDEKDRELRKKAIFWLSQSKDPRVAKFLEELISK
ncbi:MAG: HEAT repeat domain-containing protein [Gemmatimonadaceae bacterium]